MTDLEHLIEASEGEGPSPEFVAALRQRVVNEGSSKANAVPAPVVIDLNDDRDHGTAWNTPRILVAAAAVIALVGIAALLVTQNRQGFETISPPDVSTTVPDDQPAPSVDDSPPAVFELGAQPLRPVAEMLEVGTYRGDTLGTPFTFRIDASLAGEFHLRYDDQATLALSNPDSADSEDRSVLLMRVAAFSDPSRPLANPMPASAGWPASDFAGWLENARAPFVVSGAEETSIGGLAATRVDLHLEENACGSSGESCVVFATNHGADAQLMRPGSRYRVWIVEQGVEDPLAIWIAVDRASDVGWFDTAEQLLSTLAFGDVEPNPVISMSAGSTESLFLDGVRFDTPLDAIALRKNGNSDHGQILLAEWRGSTEFLRNPRSLDGLPLESTDDLIAALESIGISVVEAEPELVAGIDARVLNFDGTSAEPGLLTSTDSNDIWRQSRRVRAWVLEHPERGLLIVLAEAQENLDFAFPAALTQAESILATLEFIETG